MCPGISHVCIEIFKSDSQRCAVDCSSAFGSISWMLRINKYVDLSAFDISWRVNNIYPIRMLIVFPVFGPSLWHGLPNGYLICFVQELRLFLSFASFDAPLPAASIDTTLPSFSIIKELQGINFEVNQ